MASESKTDVLIVGAGPAGLMMANWMAHCGIDARIVDKRGTKIFNGQADGLASRTLEIFDSFGFGHRAWIESNHLLEICLWNPDENGVIQRNGRIPDTIPCISRFQQVVLHQGRIERFFLDSIASKSDIKVERGVMPTSLKLDESVAEDPDAYPITVTLRHLSEEDATPKQNATLPNGSAVADGLFRSNLSPDDTGELIRKAELNSKANTEEIVKAKYVLGADGAHSWVRQQLGFKLEGDSTDYIWGVMDIIPITDFPDIRMRCAIHSASSGSVMVIPRENKLVRLYIQLTTTGAEKAGKFDRSTITPELIIQSAQRIMAPYKITYRYCDWWTAYQIGQRVGTQFSAKERIFLAGDAVHTHSPKAGQGMNVSMQDAYNLGWKVASVVKGTANRSILKTYQSERRRIAQDLIRFDHKFSRLFSGRPAKDVMDEEGISMAEFKDAFEKGNMFASGTAVDYGSSMIVAKPGDSAEQGDGSDVAIHNDAYKVVSKPSLASKVEIGKRMASFKVLNQSDARPSHFQELLRSNGSWRVVIFPGNLLSPRQAQRFTDVGKALGASNSFLRRFTPANSRYDSVIELLAVHAGNRQKLTVFDFPEVFRPFDDKDGWDYWKIFVDDQSYHEGHGHAYENYGIDPEEGCAIIIRPDQYVSYVGPMDDYDAMDRFFSNFMVEQQQRLGDLGASDVLQEAQIAAGNPEAIAIPKAINNSTNLVAVPRQLNASRHFTFDDLDPKANAVNVLSMSLHEVWQAAASSPFQPAVGKDSQLFVGLFLLLIGLIFTGLFGLNRSLLSIPLYGIPASLAFGIGAVYTICGFGGKPDSSSNLMADRPVFTAISTSARQLHSLLRCIAFSPRAEVQITHKGIRFSVEEARVVQGLTFLDKALFSTYTLNLDDEQSLPAFSISIVALLETLQIFGIAETNSSRNPYGGFSSSYGNAFTTPALALGGTCRISYQEPGAPLTITIQEGSVTTTCEMNTYEAAHDAYEDDGGIPLDRTALCLRTIMRSTWLYDALTELSGTNPTALVPNASNRSRPYLALEGEGGPFGDSTVEFMPEAKNDPAPSGTRGQKQPLVTETFAVMPPPGSSNGRLRQRYKFDMVKRAGRAMALASKVSVRQDRQGVLSLQFMIDLGDGANAGGGRRDDAGAAAAAAVTAPPLTPGSVAFVDFRFVPLLGDDDDDDEEEEEDSQIGAESEEEEE
ncbi:phenol 2-monooxygenase, partial [Aureobasidium melanogenum]